MNYTSKKYLNEKKRKQIKQILFLFLFWLLYIEFHPKLGYMWLRPNTSNELKVSFNSLKNIIVSPFKNSYVWTINLWEINFIVFILVFYFILFNKFNED